jgi:hypothetical protein
MTAIVEAAGLVGRRTPVLRVDRPLCPEERKPMRWMNPTLFALTTWSVAAVAAAQAQKCPDCAEHGDCGWVPPYVANGSAGDIVLSQSPGGVIGLLLSSLGQTFSHSGMLLSDDQVRHNTMEVSEIELDGGGLVPERMRASGTRSLRDGAPGMITQFVTDAFNGGFNAENGLLLQGDEEMGPIRRSAAEMLVAMDGFYRLYAYTDIAWPDPFRRGDDAGSMCSGSLFWSYGLSHGAAWPTRFYGADVRDPAALTLHDIVRRKVLERDDDFNLLERVGQVVFGFLENDSIEELADNVSNQVVNCMAFDDCANTKGRWRNGVGDGASMSPDDLRGMIGQAEFPYRSEAPVVLAGGYWDCSCEKNPEGICIR